MIEGSDDEENPGAFFTVRKERIHQKGVNVPINQMPERPYFTNPKNIASTTLFRQKSKKKIHKRKSPNKKKDNENQGERFILPRLTMGLYQEGSEAS